ncbi:MAG: hypothetical protein ACW986_19620 [Promethearchaeota archaeon]
MIILYLIICIKTFYGYSLKKYSYQLGMGIFLLITAGILFALSSFLFGSLRFIILQITEIESLILLVVGLAFITLAIVTKIRS